MRPVCVELSAVALRFKGKQTTIKQVYNALREVQNVLDRHDVQQALDEKLAEYTFFPLTHIFNQAQALSSTCIESAIACVIVLVSKGWRSTIASEMAKQLLILMTLVAGGQAQLSAQVPTDEVKTVAFNCIDTIVGQLRLKNGGNQILNDVGSKSIVDQLAYLLLDAITESPSDDVQLAASQALLSVLSGISDRATLASLLPRTVSSLTKALRVSTQARRTKKVLTAHLKTLDTILLAVLADDVVYLDTEAKRLRGEEEGLDQSWLKATSEQVKIALTQVMRLRSYDESETREALAAVCFNVVQKCCRSLETCLSLVLDTLVFIAQFEDCSTVRSRLEFVLNDQPDIASLLQEKLYNWCMAIPRTLQGNEDRPKEQLFGQLSAALSIASQTFQMSGGVLNRLVTGLVNGFGTTQAVTKSQPISEEALPMIDAVSSTELTTSSHELAFGPLILGGSSESGSASKFGDLLTTIANLGFSDRFAHACLTRLSDAEVPDQITSIWLALQSLRAGHDSLSFGSLIVQESSTALELSRPRLVESLYAATLHWLSDDEYRDSNTMWQATALAVECTVLQAQLLDVSYRPELLDSLYPILSLLGSRNASLREHAITGLNLLAKACKYSSTGDMLVENVDYLVNSIGMKLNAFDLTPQAPQVLLTMVRLCGARIVPQIDDLIGSMFSALDNFHGYPEVVEALFRVLRVIVDESKKSPQLAISDSMKEPDHSREQVPLSGLADIIGDLEKRKARKRKFVADAASIREYAPQKPWMSKPVDRLSEMTDETGDVETNPEEETDPVTPPREKEPPLPKSYKLLLSIAQSTGPHLTSPSPQVRQTLLQLLEEVSPLLSQHENSFLPLINSVWPMVVPRLLAYSPLSEDTETAYNASSAADVIATLCKNAGNFMSSRIEDIFPQLMKALHDVQGKAATKLVTLLGATSKVLSTESRTPRGQVLAALLRLMCAVLEFVRVTGDIGDQILGALMPYALSVDGGSAVEAVEKYNADALWLYRQAGVEVTAAS